MNSILVVDDEDNILEVIKARLEYNNFQVDTVTSGKAALSLFKKNNYAAVLTDLYMPEMDGFNLMYEIRNYDSGVPVIFLTAHSSLEKAVKSIKDGAFNFLAKPLDDKFVTHIRDAVNHYNQTNQPAQAKALLSQPEQRPKCFSPITAESAAMKTVLSRIQKILECDTTVLIHGESGTGKELVARAIHTGGARKKEPFVVVDCGATHDMLVESELFGHVKGAFTNAHIDRKGLFELADGGSVFLDEVASTSRETQKKLLRVLQEGEIRRLGDANYRKVNVRIISATNKDLSEAVVKGTFREDLYYRLNVVLIKIPPLRERIEDIPVLTDHFLRTFARKLNKDMPKFEENIMEMMLRYFWPGNVRELKNFVESAVAVVNGGVISKHDIGGTDLLSDANRLDVPFEIDTIEKNENIDLKTNERELIVAALKKANWVQKDAAELLGISKRVMHYKIQKMKIDCKTRTY